MVRNVTNNIQSANIRACRRIEASEKFLSAEIQSGFRKIHDKILGIKVILPLRIKGIVRDQNIGKWCCGIGDIALR